MTAIAETETTGSSMPTGVEHIWNDDLDNRMFIFDLILTPKGVEHIYDQLPKRPVQIAELIYDAERR